MEGGLQLVSIKKREKNIPLEWFRMVMGVS